MKFSLSWLKDHLDIQHLDTQHLDIQADATRIAATLNAIGLEVEGVDDPATRLAGFRVARILSARRHPDADKLHILTVDAGDANGPDGQPLQVVCGAPNARAGLVGVLGLPGAVVPAGGMVLKVSVIRGVESHGMMCSARELELSDAHEGIVELPADAPVGAHFADYAGESPVFDVAITPNRPDCMGLYGIARDLAAAGLGVLKPVVRPEVAGGFPCPVTIRIEDDAGCPAFFGRVIRGVRNGPSPQWLQARLKSAGQRPISALVDLTNYLMLAYGRPAHVYDLARLKGAITARRARPGETCRALNGKTYALDETMTVIADDTQVHDIAGIMGGEDSGCSEATTDVLLEIAWFTPERIAATGRRLNLTSDARIRFERGVDPAFLEHGLDLLTALILDICGGSASQPAHAGAAPITIRAITYDPDLAATLGGVTVPEAEQKRILTALGFKVTPGVVVAPSWRPDIDAAPDIVEEVVRIHGLDRITSVPLPRHAHITRPTITPLQRMERRLRRAAAGRGLHEAITWSFLPDAEAEHFLDTGQLWRLTNPISEEMKAMRPSLLPGLLAAARRNLDRGATGLGLFEIGRRYLRGEGGYSQERLTLGIILAGEKRPRDWAAGRAVAFDAFDAKGEALALLAQAGAPIANLLVMDGAGPQFHPGQSATLRLGPKTVLARFGMFHPATLRMFDISTPVAGVEVFLDAIPARKGGHTFARTPYAPPALQAVTRDFAFLLATEVPASALVQAVRGGDRENITTVRVFDDFRGPTLPEGQKSLAVEVTFQPRQKSYTEADFKAMTGRIITAVARLGATLRA